MSSHSYVSSISSRQSPNTKKVSSTQYSSNTPRGEFVSAYVGRGPRGTDQISTYSRHRDRSNNMVRTAEPTLVATKTFTDMQRNMEDELEGRRHDWEQEVDHMKEDFFDVKSSNRIDAPPSKDVDVYKSSTPTKRGGLGTEIFDINNTNTLLSEMPDGTKVFKMRFDVSGFEPEEIDVKADDGKLTVSARHEEDYGQGVKRVARQFNRQVDMPHNVDPDQLECNLSDDGILSVEAPVDESKSITPMRVLQKSLEDTSLESSNPVDKYLYPSSSTPKNKSKGRAQNSFSSSFGQSEPAIERDESHTSSFAYSEPAEITPFSHNDSYGMPSFSPPEYQDVVSHVTSHMTPTETGISPRVYDSPKIKDTEYGPKFKIIVNLVSRDYKPEEVRVQVGRTRLYVKAKHVAKDYGRKSTKEFSRQFDTQEELEFRTVRAMLGRDGKLIIGASLKRNDNHDAILALIMDEDMPDSNELVTVERI